MNRLTGVEFNRESRFIDYSRATEFEVFLGNLEQNLQKNLNDVEIEYDGRIFILLRNDACITEWFDLHGNDDNYIVMTLKDDYNNMILTDSFKRKVFSALITAAAAINIKHTVFLKANPIVYGYNAYTLRYYESKIINHFDKFYCTIDSLISSYFSNTHADKIKVNDEIEDIKVQVNEWYHVKNLDIFEHNFESHLPSQSTSMTREHPLDVFWSGYNQSYLTDSDDTHTYSLDPFLIIKIHFPSVTYDTIVDHSKLTNLRPIIPENWNASLYFQSNSNHNVNSNSDGIHEKYFQNINDVHDDIDYSNLSSCMYRVLALLMLVMEGNDNDSYDNIHDLNDGSEQTFISKLDEIIDKLDGVESIAMIIKDFYSLESTTQSALIDLFDDEKEDEDIDELLIRLFANNNMNINENLNKDDVILGQMDSCNDDLFSLICFCISQSSNFTMMKEIWNVCMEQIEARHNQSIPLPRMNTTNPNKQEGNSRDNKPLFEKLLWDNYQHDNHEFPIPNLRSSSYTRQKLQSLNMAIVCDNFQHASNYTTTLCHGLMLQRRSPLTKELKVKIVGKGNIKSSITKRISNSFWFTKQSTNTNNHRLSQYKDVIISDIQAFKAKTDGDNNLESFLEFYCPNGREDPHELGCLTTWWSESNACEAIKQKPLFEPKKFATDALKCIINVPVKLLTLEILDSFILSNDFLLKRELKKLDNEVERLKIEIDKYDEIFLHLQVIVRQHQSKFYINRDYSNDNEEQIPQKNGSIQLLVTQIEKYIHQIKLLEHFIIKMNLLTGLSNVDKELAVRLALDGCVECINEHQKNILESLVLTTSTNPDNPRWFRAANAQRGRENRKKYVLESSKKKITLIIEGNKSRVSLIERKH